MRDSETVVLAMTASDWDRESDDDEMFFQGRKASESPDSVQRPSRSA